MPFLEEEQPENYQNMLFWQKLYMIPPVLTCRLFSDFEVQFIPTEASYSLNRAYFQNVPRVVLGMEIQIL